ncbi:MAG TPA: chromosome segregation protein SMC [Pirellulaceae bacterium]|nr:chromosome segregation protein SMC [Pirellulaceae bacterium]
MLKALELIGFKSFADKTRFDFPEGITVVVGPNGSGKSNIVDAMKWVLGSQSAKALRGKDMSDVIFKGSSDGRRMMNTAEATIIFENADGRLPLDAPEVHVTRRVYRSGESEYLINREPCRLKDIKDLFRGTGVGVDAYSLIEQGKVDRLLQASARDRRAIFEEAAGISRFKAKKLEAQRRLERVDQNLLRLSDIVEEVESRLRSVRSQASKAKRYREFSARLQELRTQVGMTDWRRLTDKLAVIEEDLASLVSQSSALVSQIEAAESRALELETRIEAATDTVRQCERQIADNHEGIALLTSSAEQARTRSGDFAEAAQRHRTQLAITTGRASSLSLRYRETTDQLGEAETVCRTLHRQLNDYQQAEATHREQFASLRVDNQERCDCHQQDSGELVGLQKQISRQESELAALNSTERRCASQLEELEKLIAKAVAELRQFEQAQAESAATQVATRKRLDAAQLNLDQSEQSATETHDNLVRQRERLIGVQERAKVLEELESSQEGLATGVRDVLELARQATDGPFGDVTGLVADLLQVGVDLAPLVDVALGEKAQFVVLASGDLLEEIQSLRFRPAGRVGFVCLHNDGPPLGIEIELDGRPRVVGRMDRLVTYPPTMKPLIQRMLGDTWLIESMPMALALRKTYPALRFVTTSGDLVDYEGSVTVGPRQATSGLISRRSQLHALRLEEAALGEQTSTLEAIEVRLHETISKQSSAVSELNDEFKQASDTFAEQRMRTRAVQERHQQLGEQRSVLQAELETTQTQSATVQSSRVESLATSKTLMAGLAEIAALIRSDDEQMQQLDEQRQEHALQATAAKVELEKSSEHLENLRARQQQLEEDQRERDRTTREARTQVRFNLNRQQSSQRELLRASSELARMFLDKESMHEKRVGLVAAVDSLVGDKSGSAGEIQSLRRQAQKLDEQQHRHDLAAGEVRHQRNALAERMKDDYGIEIDQLDLPVTAEQQQEQVDSEEEINTLRRKINNIGAVNMDALEELDELETRFGTLSGQYQDLAQAKASLEKIIHRINADSRRMFEETLDAVRENFQTLYRKSFGGGRADLVVEEGVDPLEAGIEIIATPPGKPSFNNSLLSGGEKALTAVALLLAIFQYRPSPFCVLDEVDAPFDEANVGRFIAVLREFLDWTKFVVVTHSKQTMTAATTLYGVTMQESGVSKRVSVRFEDVSEDGHISEDAIAQDKASDDDERGAA